MYSLSSFLWLLGIGYLIGFYRGQKSTCQPMTFVTQLFVVSIALVVLTVLFKTTFGVHVVFMR
jgi:hypothetical protein